MRTKRFESKIEATGQFVKVVSGLGVGGGRGLEREKVFYNMNVYVIVHNCDCSLFYLPHSVCDIFFVTTKRNLGVQYGRVHLSYGSTNFWTVERWLWQHC